MRHQSKHSNFPKLSYWEKVSFFKGIDVAIIGSGIVGLSAAIHLKTISPKIKVAIFERGTLPAGASTRNAGFACFGSLSELVDDMEHHTENEVFELVEKRWNGLQKLRQRIGDKKLGYQELGGFELFRSDEKDKFEKCIGKMEYFNEQVTQMTKRKQVYRTVDKLIQGFGFQGVNHLVLNEAEGQIHTGKMMKSLLDLAREKEVGIYSGIGIKEVVELGNSAKLICENNWEIDTSKVVIATNGFAKMLLPELSIKAVRNQVLITEPIKDLRFQGCFHYDKGYYYFRNIDQRILLGGGRNLAFENETTNQFGTTKLIREALQKLLIEVIIPKKEVKIDQWWSGILGVGDSKKTIVKKHSKNIFVAVRMGGMGVAIGSLIGEEIAQMVAEA